MKLFVANPKKIISDINKKTQEALTLLKETKTSLENIYNFLYAISSSDNTSETTLKSIEQHIEKLAKIIYSKTKDLNEHYKSIMKLIKRFSKTYPLRNPELREEVQLLLEYNKTSIKKLVNYASNKNFLRIHKDAILRLDATLKINLMDQTNILIKSTSSNSSAPIDRLYALFERILYFCTKSMSLGDPKTINTLFKFDSSRVIKTNPDAPLYLDTSFITHFYEDNKSQGTNKWIWSKTKNKLVLPEATKRELTHKKEHFTQAIIPIDKLSFVENKTILESVKPSQKEKDEVFYAWRDSGSRKYSPFEREKFGNSADTALITIALRRNPKKTIILTDDNEDIGKIGKLLNERGKTNILIVNSNNIKREKIKLEEEGVLQ